MHFTLHIPTVETLPFPRQCSLSEGSFSPSDVIGVDHCVVEVSRHSQWCKEPIYPVAFGAFPPETLLLPRPLFGVSILCFLCLFESVYIHSMQVMCSVDVSRPLCVHLTMNSVQSLTLPLSHTLMMEVIYWERIQQLGLDPQRKGCRFLLFPVLVSTLCD